MRRVNPNPVLFSVGDPGSAWNWEGLGPRGGPSADAMLLRLHVERDEELPRRRCVLSTTK